MYGTWTWLYVLIVLGTAAGAGASGYPFVRWVLARAARSADGGQPQEDTPQAQTLRGGTWIGLLERIAVVVAIMLGHPAGIAYVIAIKGLGRYPELKNHPQASERFVIGTLASIVWAALLAALSLSAAVYLVPGALH